MNDGGPAFPSSFKHNAIQGINGEAIIDIEYCKGMSLHDYFRSEQTAAWIIALSSRFKEEGYSDENAIDEAVRLGRLTANAMIDDREEQ